MLQELSVRVQGNHPTGGRIPWSEQQEAIRLMEELKRGKMKMDHADADQRRADEKSNRQSSRLLLDAEIRHQELQLEQQRIHILKAEVIVQALAIAEKGGVSAEQLLLAVSGLGESLMGEDVLRDAREKVPILAIPVKEDEEP